MVFVLVIPHARQPAFLPVPLFTADVPLVTERTMRSVHSSLTENNWHDKHYDKMVLLHSLGNAANERSKALLVSHLGDDNIPSIWKRAAATALGQYSCEEVSSNILVKLLWYIM